MHAIRKQFLKKVYWTYISEIDKSANDGVEVSEFTDENFQFKSDHDKINYKRTVLNNVDLMQVKLVYTLYKQLAYKLKDRLKDLISTGQSTAVDAEDKVEEQHKQDKKHIRPLIMKQIAFAYDLPDKGKSAEAFKKDLKLANYPKFVIGSAADQEALHSFLKVAFERLTEEEKDQIDIYGAKILLAGSDRALHGFLQEYVGACLSLDQVKRSTLQRKVQIYIVPHGIVGENPHNFC